MTSKIVPGNVDGLFPTAGQDNSSQGFRDNFSAILTNFTEAKSEIEALILKFYLSLIKNWSEWEIL